MIRRVIVSTVRKSSVTNAIAATAGRSKRSFSIRNNVSFTQSANINKISDIPNANRGVRPLSTTVNDSAIKEKNQTDKGKDVSDLFLDNLGKLFFGAIFSVIALLVRSSYGTSNQAKERDLLEETSVLDPLEVDDLRTANHPDFNSILFSDIVLRTRMAFPSGEASYFDFVSVVMDTIRLSHGKNLQFGHLLDRVVIDVLENSDKYNAVAHNKDDSKLPLKFLLTLLSLALSGPVDDRIQCLFDVMSDEVHRDGDAISNGSSKIISDSAVPETEVVEMIGYLQNSWQLPPGPQVLATEEKYPTQQYRRGTPRKLLRLAKEDALGLKSTETKDTSNHLEDKQRYDVDDFEALLRSSYICAWGECYGPKAVKKRA
eukprot:CAMPEP_0172418970 /NCGR_PEP_ID=MMETSP1064-20121228/5408_1 /TAXON_ID=202472 /ORGANISM="Aulacoseira subarctica , Strain CCAP 1002/5" /LENGTH=372 /DNA_ID=CAMNT_0013158171 /DNA_START=66 /DNA_END=1184 /DNA_ORIENTATION=+